MWCCGVGAVGAVGGGVWVVVFRFCRIGDPVRSGWYE